MRVLSALAMALLAVAGSAQAGEYMFSLSWEPSFCATHQDKSECRAMTPESYDANHLVLHGLWPQGGQYCGQQGIDDGTPWDQLPPVQVSDATRARMDKVFPGVVSLLDRHEWYKHGTCSGLDPDGYFTLAMDLVEQANAMAVGKLVTASVGKTVAMDDVCGALGQDLGSAVLKSSAIIQKGGSLTEMRFALHDTGKKLALDPDHLSAGKKTVQCTGNVRIPAVGKPKS